jgi:hypothetical protein
MWSVRIDRDRLARIDQLVDFHRIHVRRERSQEQVAVSCHRIAGGEPDPAPGCSALRRAPGVGRLARQGERFAWRRTGRQSDLGPEQPRYFARKDRVLVHPLAVPLQEPGPGLIRQCVEVGPLLGSEGAQPGDLSRGQGRSGSRGRGRASRARRHSLVCRGEPEDAAEALEVDGASEPRRRQAMARSLSPPRPRPLVAEVDSDPFSPEIQR